mmetsp:Transcript_28215/g.76163  ORF Transcript_28215/g.76163 Transcript_28215/m.76163 type:complete len:301 (+) Transcript_28215:751-1653(+)
MLKSGHVVPILNTWTVPSYVHIGAFPIAVPNLVGCTRTREICPSIKAVDGSVHNAAAVVEHVLGPIAMMDVPIHDQYTGCTRLLGGPCCNSCIIEKAKAHGQRCFRVMTRRAHNCCAIQDLLCSHSNRYTSSSASSNTGAVVCVSVDWTVSDVSADHEADLCKVVIIVDRGLCSFAFLQLHFAVPMLGKRAGTPHEPDQVMVMDSFQLLGSCFQSIHLLASIQQPSGFQQVHNRGDTCRTLHMLRPARNNGLVVVQHACIIGQQGHPIWMAPLLRWTVRGVGRAKLLRIMTPFNCRRKAT